MSQPTVSTGLDRLQGESFARLRGQRVGLLCHPASVNGELIHASRILRDAPGVDLRCLFGPQHGFRGETQDNMVEWDGFTDPATGLPVYSLYGDTRKPTPEMLEGIDTLVVDLQDVGARYYTFLWTLFLAMEACAEQGKRVVVLDRPNPLGGARREGTVLDPAYRSFVGLAPIPMRHGLTLGELALWFQEQLNSPPSLDVVWMQGWRRDMAFEDTGLPWVMPSPNMPTPDTARVYPGFCLLEGTELSEGRGTTRPFELFGAPFVDPERLVRRLAEYDLPGARFRPAYFQPMFQKHAGRLCGGAQVYGIDRESFEPVQTAAAVLIAIRELWPDRFRWRQPPYEYETKRLPIDILAGGPWFREDVEAGVSPHRMAARWRPSLDTFDRMIQPYLRYD